MKATQNQQSPRPSEVAWEALKKARLELLGLEPEEAVVPQARDEIDEAAVKELSAAGVTVYRRLTFRARKDGSLQLDEDDKEHGVSRPRVNIGLRLPSTKTHQWGEVVRVGLPVLPASIQRLSALTYLIKPGKNAVFLIGVKNPMHEFTVSGAKARYVWDIYDPKTGRLGRELLVEAAANGSALVTIRTARPETMVSLVLRGTGSACLADPLAIGDPAKERMVC